MENKRFLSSAVINAREISVVLPWERKGLRRKPVRRRKL